MSDKAAMDDLRSLQGGMEAVHVDPNMALNPLRSHYLKRELVRLQVAAEVEAMERSASLSALGPPFEANHNEFVELPMLRYMFQNYVVKFPFLKKFPGSFYSSSVQPFFESLYTLGFPVTLMDPGSARDKLERQSIWRKIERAMSLFMSSAISLEQKEDIIRLNPFLEEQLKAKQIQSSSHGAQDDGAIEVNIIAVRTAHVRTMMHVRKHDEFIVETRLGNGQVTHVARRYGDFVHLSNALLDEFPHGTIPSLPAKDKRETTADIQDDAGDDSDDSLADGNTNTNHQTSRKSLRREHNRVSLRAFLREIMLDEDLSQASVLRSFLVDYPISLSRAEKEDVSVRDQVDKARSSALRNLQAEAGRRIQELDEYWRDLQNDLTQPGGLTALFDVIKNTSRITDLPENYQKVIEWACINAATSLFLTFQGSDTAPQTLGNLKTIHNMMPYTLLRGILKISNPIMMMRGFLDLFLARPFGSPSLIQKMFSSSLSNGSLALRDLAERVRKIIDNPIVVLKVDKFIEMPREFQVYYRMEADERHLPIEVVILMIADDPETMINSQTIARIRRGAQRYDYRQKQTLSIFDPESYTDKDPDVAFFSQVRTYLRAVVKAREKEQMVSLIFEGRTGQLFKDIVVAFYEPLVQVYQAANITESLSDLQQFLTDLIKTAESNEAVTNPRVALQVYIDLVTRHQDHFYKFVHNVHNRGHGVFDSLVAWVESILSMSRGRGFDRKLSLEDIMPQTYAERRKVIDEIDTLLAHYRQVKQLRLERKIAKSRVLDPDPESDRLLRQNAKATWDNIHDAVDDDDEDEEDLEEDEFHDAQPTQAPSLKKAQLPLPPCPNIRRLQPLFSEQVSGLMR